MTTANPKTPPPIPGTIGRYRILHKLGEGGMGVVYAARDEQLDRSVAIKMIREVAATPESRERLWREARAAASVSHPNVCQLYEVGEDNGAIYLAMEMLEGESLATRVVRGPMPLAEAVQTTLAMLSALEALHRRGVIHRDLKPSNVYLTPHGVKLLDFGLARPTESSEPDLTQPGMVVGTPRYMAPEQWQGAAVDPRTDLFTVGALLYEMLVGRTAFEGATMMEICRAIATDQPPALTGSAAIVAADQVIHRALAKKPEARFPSADAMAKDLRGALLLVDTQETTAARPMTRLIVLPFRVLRPDPDIDFLAFSLPDAITTSLSGLDSLVVRSSLAAAKFAGDAVDLKKIASEAEVDVVLSGTLLRAGEQLRVSTQLAEAAGGTLLWSKTSQVSMGDIFQLQDDLTRQIVESLALPLSARERGTLDRDVPVSPQAYEYYLRANSLGNRPITLRQALEYYLKCLEIDPRFAPAWARLGRVYRMIAKMLDEDPVANLELADAAFRRALAINPELSIAHNLYAQLEVDMGRARDAMVRLLHRAEARRGDPELFAGLVHACRYCGLLDFSVAAWERARHLDPGVRTSVAWTFWLLEDYVRAIETDTAEFRFVKALALLALGRNAETLEIVNALERETPQGTLLFFNRALRAILENDPDTVIESMDSLTSSSFRDGEGLFMAARFYARSGDNEKSLATLKRVVNEGFHCFAAMARDAWLDPLRAEPEFTRVLRQAETLSRESAAAFTAAGGERVLGAAPR